MKQINTKHIVNAVPAALAAAGAAHGAIIHTEVDVIIPGGDKWNEPNFAEFDLTGDGIPNFALGFEAGGSTDLFAGWADVSFQTLDDGSTQAAVNDSGELQGFNPWWGPQEVGPSQTFSPEPAYPLHWWHDPKGEGVVWHPYIGLSTVIDDQTHYAWVQIQLASGDFGAITGLHVVDFAYESTPNLPIAIGAVPAPGTLALLALGAVAGTRRKRIAA